MIFYLPCFPPAPSGSTFPQGSDCSDPEDPAHRFPQGPKASSLCGGSMVGNQQEVCAGAQVAPDSQPGR